MSSNKRAGVVTAAEILGGTSGLFDGPAAQAAHAKAYGAQIVGAVWRSDWTEEQFLKHLEQLEQIPEAKKALELYNSKLYKALK